MQQVVGKQHQVVDRRHQVVDKRHQVVHMVEVDNQQQLVQLVVHKYLLLVVQHRLVQVHILG